jgi:hypothetical protein
LANDFFRKIAEELSSGRAERSDGALRVDSKSMANPKEDAVHILVVDDDRRIREMLRRYFEQPSNTSKICPASSPSQKSVSPAAKASVGRPLKRSFRVETCSVAGANGTAGLRDAETAVWLYMASPSG